MSLLIFLQGIECCPSSFHSCLVCQLQIFHPRQSCDLLLHAFSIAHAGQIFLFQLIGNNGVILLGNRNVVHPQLTTVLREGVNNIDTSGGQHAAFCNSTISILGGCHQNTVDVVLSGNRIGSVQHTVRTGIVIKLSANEELIAQRSNLFALNSSRAICIGISMDEESAISSLIQTDGETKVVHAIGQRILDPDSIASGDIALGKRVTTVFQLDDIQPEGHNHILVSIGCQISTC